MILIFVNLTFVNSKLETYTSIANMSNDDDLTGFENYLKRRYFFY